MRKYPVNEKCTRTYGPWIISLAAAKMSTAVKHKEPAVISLIVLLYTAVGIMLAYAQRTDIPFKIQICELELLLSFSLPAVTYTSETGQLEIINSQSLRILHFLNEWNIARWGTFCSQQEHQRVQRLWSNDCRYANSALPVSVEKHPPCYCRLRTTVCVSLSLLFSQR